MSNPNLSAYVADHLRACQLKQLSILEEVDRICKKHGIGYWLDGGSLLGAVRHGGFIPWDDDIDIGMTKSDLERFEKIAPAELPETLFLQTRRSDPAHKSSVVKIRDRNSLYIEDADFFKSDYEKGLFIDIFPFVSCPSMPKSLVKRLGHGVSIAHLILHRAHYYSLRSFAEFFYFGGKYLLYRGLWGILKPFFPKRTYISNIVIQNWYGTRHRKDSVFPLSEIMSEGRNFNAPADPDAYLRDLYRDYMTIPPEGKRKIHAVYLHPDLKQDIPDTSAE